MAHNMGWLTGLEPATTSATNWRSTNWTTVTIIIKINIITHLIFKKMERETRVELATFSLEGWRSTNWATPAIFYNGRCSRIWTCDPLLPRQVRYRTALYTVTFIFCSVPFGQIIYYHFYFFLSTFFFIFWKKFFNSCKTRVSHH